MLGKVVTSEELNKLKWTNKRIAEAIQDILVRENPSFAITDEFIGQITGLLENKNNRYFFLYNESLKSIEGFLSVRPLKEELYKRVLKGNFEYEETLQQIAELKGEVNLYIGGISITTRHRSTIGNFRRMIHALLDYLYTLMKHDIIIKDVIARGLTEDGKRLCMGMGMKYLCDHKEKGLMFRADLTDDTHKQQPLIQYLSGMKNDRI
jgi:hypothetical protein